MALARRNMQPLYAHPIIPRTNSEDAEVDLRARKYVLVQALHEFPSLSRALGNSTPASLALLQRRVEHDKETICTELGQRCGMLDYYKDSEYQNLVQFVKALQKYEDTHQLNIADNFMDWFWDMNILDLKSNW